MKNRSRIGIFVLLSLLVLQLTAAPVPKGKPEEVGMSTERLQRIEQMIVLHAGECVDRVEPMRHEARDSPTFVHETDEGAPDGHAGGKGGASEIDLPPDTGIRGGRYAAANRGSSHRRSPTAKYQPASPRHRQC